MKKQWYFYDEKGKVYLIYMVEPSQEMLDKNYYIVADETKDKEGFNTKILVDLKTKELKVEYIKKEPTLEENLKMLIKNNKLTDELANTKKETEKVSKQSESINANLMQQMMTLKFSIINR